MRLLIDECLPRGLKRLLRGHTSRTVHISERAAALRYAASDHSLGEAAVFPWTASVQVQSFAPSPRRVFVKILTRDVTRCLDDTHIFQTSDRIKAPGMCVSTI